MRTRPTALARLAQLEDKPSGYVGGHSSAACSIVTRAHVPKPRCVRVKEHTMYATVRNAEHECRVRHIRIIEDERTLPVELVDPYAFFCDRRCNNE